jgi:hypothetical protein
MCIVIIKCSPALCAFNAEFQYFIPLFFLKLFIQSCAFNAEFQYFIPLFSKILFIEPCAFYAEFQYFIPLFNKLLFNKYSADNSQDGMKHQMRGATQAQQGMTLWITLITWDVK